jgi:hypothetical protein
MDFAFLGLNVLGGLLKYVVPTKVINKFIPVINYAVATVGRKVMTGMPWSACALQGLYDTGAATAVYETAKIPSKIKKEKE